MMIKKILTIYFILLWTFDSAVSQNEAVSNTKGIPVLMFHRVVNRKAKNKYEINIQEFKQILGLLKDEGFSPVGMDEITQGTFRKECIGKKLFLMTFDDAHISQLKFSSDGKLNPKCALAILLSYFENPRATFFINTRNGGAPFVYQSQKKINFLIEKGMIIGNHTASHKRVDKLTDSELLQELADVFLYLNKLGHHSKEMFFAYPYGIALNKEKQKLLKAFKYEGCDYCITAAFSSRLGYKEKRPKAESEHDYPLLCPIGGCEAFEKRRYDLPRINIHSVEDLKIDVIENDNIYIYLDDN